MGVMMYEMLCADYPFGRDSDDPFDSLFFRNKIILYKNNNSLIRNYEMLFNISKIYKG